MAIHPSVYERIKNLETPGEAAAAWWREVLRAPMLDNGDQSPQTQTLTLMSMLQNEESPQPEEALESFEELLAAAVNAELEENPYDGVVLRVDYHPEGLLEKCGYEAGLMMSMSRWPFKTNAVAHNNRVTVRYGYGSEAQEIWTSS